MAETKLYTPFLEATRDVFQLMLDLSEVSERPVDGFSNEDGLDITIGIVGDLEGEVVYRFPRDTSMSMVNIMSGMEVDTVDDFVVSAIAEIANIISGNVLMTLAANHVSCDILPPSIGAPKEEGAYALREHCCITTKAGDVQLDIRLNRADAAKPA